VAILGIVAAIGIWLGEFGWFGGNVSTKENMAIVACILGLTGSGLICRKRWLSLLTVPLYLTASQAIFIVGIALGQTWYFSPLLSEFNEIFFLAIQGRL